VTGTRCSTPTTLSSARNSLALQGREVNTSGDGFLAMFDGPQRAIRCAMSIRDVVQALGIEVRAGLHTGDCEVRGDDIGGIAVHIGARVSALAGPNDVLVSSTLRDLVIGSGLEFEDRGAYERSRRTRPVAPLRSRLSVSLPSKRRLVVVPLGVAVGMGNRRRRKHFRDSRAVPDCELVRRRWRLAQSCSRVLLRRGIFRPRFGWALGRLAGAGAVAVVRHRVGNSRRLPGCVA